MMTKREGIKAAIGFIKLVDDPDATAQVVNLYNEEIYHVQRQSSVFLVTWAGPGCNGKT